jgi:hypothetical protein
VNTFYVEHFRVQSVHANNGISKVLLVATNPQSQELIHAHTASFGFREGEEVRGYFERITQADTKD